MILFRLLSFVARIIASFVFVFILQIQFDGKTLESYLNDFGQRFFMTKALKTVSQDLVKVGRKELSSPREEEEGFEKKPSSTERQISSSGPAQYVKGFMDRVTFPKEAQESATKTRSSQE